jgi:uncharacterized caspase-like protein
MKSKLRLQKRLNKTFIAALTLMLGAIGVLLWPSGSHAQQEPNRQLVQSASTNPNAGKRIALVIGNGAYTKAPPLKNPPNDARDMAATLRTLGFDVASGINTNQRDMKRLIREFGQKLKAGGSGLFYYAGHGVQSKGRNYLIPIDADIQSEAEVEDSGVDASLVLNYMDDAQNGLNIVILDACRNNPFSRSFRSASEGLAQVDAPTGTLIAYATAPGRVASDGTGQNGLYTSELLKQMRVPGLSATDMFMRVRAEVMKQTSSKQVPWEASSLVGTFYFTAGANSTASNSGTSNAAPSETKFDASAFEYSYWETIKSSTNADDFKAYLEKYPAGQFVSLAKNRITTLEAVSKPRDSKPESVNNSATELAFWDSVKNSTSADDYRAYLEKYPNGEFAVLANNRLKSLDLAAKAKGKIFEVEWEVSRDSYTTARIVILDARFRFERDQQDIRNDAQGWAKANKEDVETAFNQLNRWYKDNWNCSAFKTSKTDEAFIREVRPVADDLAGHPTYGLRFKSPAEATEALQEIQRVCQASPTTTSSNSLEGTTWKGDSSGGDKHYEFQFLPNGEVVWHIKWSRLNDPTYKGTFSQTGDTISMDFPGVHNGTSPVAAKISGDKMTGSFAFGQSAVRWDNGMYKFTVEKVQ